MVDFTIIIPHRNNAFGLWSTINSCEIELAATRQRPTPFNYNYVLVTNGDKLDDVEEAVLHYLYGNKKLLKHIHTDEPMSPPTARQLGAEAADGNILFFFDNHCLVAKDYFHRAMADFQHLNIDMLHSTTRFWCGFPDVYHYMLRLEYNFWAHGSMEPAYQHKPYRIAAGGHGGFAVRKDVWNEVGGYGPRDLLVGYGGEEMIFDLKLGRMGKSVWLDPQVIHYHYAGKRGYSRHYTDQYYENMLVSAFVIGGEKWLWKLGATFAGPEHIKASPQFTMYEIVERAYYRAVDYAAHLDSTSQMDLDGLLAYYKDNQVAM